MTKRGLNKYEGKERRRLRRKNHVARDLHTPKYRQRTKEGKRPPPPEPDIDDWDEEY